MIAATGQTSPGPAGVTAYAHARRIHHRQGHVFTVRVLSQAILTIERIVYFPGTLGTD
jgi:hypothetical protein